ncbi:protein kinase family protein [Aquicella lusitana]|nr:protein kinase family protein [Aquicella lusitana]
MPEGIKTSDLDKDGRLMPAGWSSINTVQTAIAYAEEEGRIKESEDVLLSKKELGTKFSFIKLKDRSSLQGFSYYAIYPEVTLGKGAFGKVVIAQNIETGKWYALKKQAIKSGSEKKLRSLAEAEKMLLTDLKRSPLTPIKGRRSPSKNLEHYMLLMELEEGETIQSLVDQEKDFILRIPPPIRLQIAIEILRAGKTLFEEKGFILHRDIKEANIVANLSELEAKLIDFGLSVKADPDGKYVSTSLAGSIDVVAPELRAEMVACQDDPSRSPQFIYSQKTEVYGYGALLAGWFGMFDNSDAVDEQTDDWKPIKEWMENTFIVNESHPYFLDNGCMPKDKFGGQLLREILACIHEMTHYDAADPDQKNRCSLDQAITKLEEIKKKYIQHYGAKANLRVGVLDIEKYLDEDTDKQKTLNQFDDFDEIILVDSSGKDRGINFYLDLKRELKKAIQNKSEALGEPLSVIFSEEVYISSNKKMLQEKVDEHLAWLKEKAIPVELNPVVYHSKPNVEISDKEFAHSGYSSGRRFR